MAVRIRLQRRGSKKRPVYAIVAAEQTMPRDGRFLEKLGVYDPRQEANKATVRGERLAYWLGVGARMSDTVAAVLKREGLLPNVQAG
ncbi:MAG: 30S ribosomal protein S16 [Magnetococcales bacterium]|nr:30S ribosomal protein S16 [Magnetococcales bacterium]